MDVILIQPPQSELRLPNAYIPLGLAYLASPLIKSGLDVGVINLGDAEEVEKVDIPDADWYGLTCTSATYPAVKKLVSILGEKGKTIVGGVHPSLFPSETYKDMTPDAVMMGEAEFMFRDVVLGITDLNSVMDAGIIEDLDQLPFPARHLFDEDWVVDRTGIHGQGIGERATTLITSRGCPYGCHFCCKGHEMLSGYRFRGTMNVIREVEQLKETYNMNHFRFVDDEFTLNKKRTQDLMMALVHINITWVCITRADSLDPNLLNLMYDAGCKEIHIGVETGSDRLLKLMNKNITVEQLEKGVKMIKDADIKVKTYLMYNYPGETENDRLDTIKFIERTKPDKFTLSNFTPLPGSKISQFTSNYDKGWFYTDGESGFEEYRERIREAMN